MKATSIFVTAALSLLWVACGGKNVKSQTSTAIGNNQAEAVAEVDTLEVKPFAYRDSASVNGLWATVSMSIQVPQGRSREAIGVDQWIQKQLGAKKSIGDQSIAQVAKEVGDSCLSSAIADLKDFEPDWAASYAYEWHISKLYENKNWLTFSSTYYAYTAGAHGSTFFTPVSFVKSSMTPITFAIFKPQSAQALKDLIIHGLMEQYFEVKTMEEFNDCLLVNNGEFTLPTTAPWIEGDGIHFIYQQYEIAPYAAGMPGCVLPFDKVAPLLNEDIKVLLPE